MSSMVEHSFVTAVASRQPSCSIRAQFARLESIRLVLDAGTGFLHPVQQYRAFKIFLGVLLQFVVYVPNSQYQSPVTIIASLSFIPPSCMVMPNREIANINLSSYNSAMSNSMEVNAISEDINMDEPRGRSLLSSPNTSREMSAHSDLSSIPYVDRIEAQNNDFS